MGKEILGTLIIVHHKPGLNVGYKVIDIYAKRLSKELSTRTLAVPLNDLKKIMLGEEDMIFAMLISRGKHYEHVKGYAEDRGIRFIGSIPEKIVAGSISKASREFGCKSPLAIYHSVKHEELVRISELLKEHVRFLHVNEVNQNEVRRHDCMISLTVLPSRITGPKFRVFHGYKIKYLLPFMINDITLWLKGVVR